MPDGDTTPIRVPQSLVARARPHHGGHAGHRRAPAGRPALRRPRIVHRRRRASDRGRAAGAAGRPASEPHGADRRSPQFMEAALYDADGGFYAAGGRAGRRGDFLTSPEVGPAVRRRAGPRARRLVGRARPAGPVHVVIDAGAGPGTLARACCAAAAGLLGSSGALALRRASSVSAAAARRAPTGSPRRVAEPALPDGAVRSASSLANELLDNLPFRLAVYDGEWREAYVDVAARRRRRAASRCSRPFDRGRPRACPSRAAHGARAPVQDAGGRVGARRRSLALRRGRRWSSSTTRRPPAELAARPVAGVAAHLPGPRAGRPLPRRARHAGHHRRRGRSTSSRQPRPRPHPGRSSSPPTASTSWSRRAAASGPSGPRPDLAALRARSRVREAEALTDPAGLGGFTVLEWRRRLASPARRLGWQSAS